MNYKIFLSCLVVLSLSHLPVQASCPEGNVLSTDYIQRNSPNRCEGIQRETISANILNLISIATKNLTSYGDTLSMRIPRISGSNSPQINLRSLDENYQLDNPTLSKNGSFFSFTWDTFVLKKANIATTNLRALAYFNLGSQIVYVPVILGQPSGRYEFVFYTPSSAEFSTFEILSQGKQIYSIPRKNVENGEIVFTWDARNAPSGRYELHFVATIETRNQPPQKLEHRIIFEHNAKWLK